MLYCPALPCHLDLFCRANRILTVVIIAGVKQRANSIPPFFYLPGVKKSFFLPSVIKDTSRDHRQGENLTTVLGRTKGPSRSSSY